MRRAYIIMGFWDRIEAVCLKADISKNEIARRMGVHRHTIYRREGQGMDALTLARFCAVTGADANYLLGLSRKGEE